MGPEALKEVVRLKFANRVGSCPECGGDLELTVLSSGSGRYFVGTECLCGPRSQESREFRSLREAERELKRILRG